MSAATYRRYLARLLDDGFAVAVERMWDVDVLADAMSFEEAVDFLHSLGDRHAVSTALAAKAGDIGVFYKIEEETA